MTPSVDGLTIGGGPAGLTAASTLARAVHSSIVFDDGTYRNRSSNDIHMVLTADSETPMTYRQKARDELLHNYDTIKFEDTSIISVRKVQEGFEAKDSKGITWQGKKLTLATGVEDTFPAIEGYAECWGTGM